MFYVVYHNFSIVLENISHILEIWICLVFFKIWKINPVFSIFQNLE